MEKKGERESVTDRNKTNWITQCMKVHCRSGNKFGLDRKNKYDFYLFFILK